jgi:hypothetical protein
VHTEVAVVEDHLLLEPEVAYQPLEREPVLLPMLLRDPRMRLARDEVDRIRVAGHDGGHRADRHLDALARRDEAEGRQ